MPGHGVRDIAGRVGRSPRTISREHGPRVAVTGPQTHHRFVMLLHLPAGHGALAVQEALLAKIATLPEQLRLSLTWDQGKEMSNHVAVTRASGLDIYFCDPHSPWQRGSNENTNGLLRQYLPKGTDLSFYGPGLLDNIAAELNTRPRKRHAFQTPAEVLDQLLSQATNNHGVA